MVNCLIYSRVSTEEQKEEGQSMETQISLCQKWAKENGNKVIGIYKDAGKTATNMNRAGLKDLLARCQEDNSIEAVLVQDTDRMARNTEHHLTIKSILKNSGIRLISVSQPMIDDSPEGNFIDVVIAGVNTFQSQITGRKTAKVLDQKVEMGWWAGWSPLGYKNVTNPNPTSNLDRRIIKPDPEKAPYITQAFKLYSSGNYTIKSLAEALHQKGLRSQTGLKTSTSILHRILGDPFYIGKMRRKGEILPAKHKPLIDEDTYNLCQEIMAMHNQHASRQRIHDFLLRGFAFCECGRRIWSEVHNKKGIRYGYYFCKNCGRGSYTASGSLEKQVESKFRDLEISPEYAEYVIEITQELLADFRSNSDEENRSLFVRKAKVEAAMREVEDSWLIHKTITEEAFKRIYPRYEEELQNIQRQLSQITQDHSSTIKTIETLLNLAKNIGGTYASADNKLKRSYLGLFFKRFTLINGKIVKTELTEPVKSLLGKGKVRVRSNWLPLVDAFKNREIEFGFSLQNIQTVFETFEIQPRYATS